MVLGRILDSNNGVVHGDGSVLEIRPATRGARTNGKRGWTVADLISISLPNEMAMVRTAFVMIGRRGERPRRRVDSVLVRADNEAAVTWVRRCRRGGKKKARVETFIDEDGGGAL